MEKYLRTEDGKLQLYCKECEEVTSLQLQLWGEQVQGLSKNATDIPDTLKKAWGKQDADLKDKLASLALIDLRGCWHVTDAGIKAFAAAVLPVCGKLKQIRLDGCPQVTDDSVKWISKNLPPGVFTSVSVCATSVILKPDVSNLRITSNAEDIKSDKQILISYHWSDKPVVLKIRDRLQAAGYTVWMDLDNMSDGGSTLEAIAEAVQQATVVLICMSAKYKESSNYRTEAEYAFKLRKDIVPVCVQNDYKPDGFLGMMIATGPYADITASESHMMWQLMQMIKSRGIMKGDALDEQEDTSEKLDADKAIKDYEEYASSLPSCCVCVQQCSGITFDLASSLLGSPEGEKSALLQYQRCAGIGRVKTVLLQAPYDHPLVSTVLQQVGLPTLVVLLTDLTSDTNMSAVSQHVEEFICQMGQGQAARDCQLLVVGLHQLEDKDAEGKMKKIKEAVSQQLREMYHSHSKLAAALRKRISEGDKLTFPDLQAASYMLAVYDLLRGCVEKDQPVISFCQHSTKAGKTESLVKMIEEKATALTCDGTTAKRFLKEPETTKAIKQIKVMNKKVMTFAEVKRELEDDKKFTDSLGKISLAAKHAVSSLQKKGQILLVEHQGEILVVLDPEWFTSVTSKLSVTASRPSGCEVRGVEPGTPVWSNSTLPNKGLCQDLDHTQLGLLLRVMLGVQLVLQLPTRCRQATTDPKYYLADPLTLNEPSETKRQEVMSSPGFYIKKNYIFNRRLPERAFTRIIASFLRVISPVLLWKQGLFFHLSACQVYVSVDKNNAGRAELIVQVCCGKIEILNSQEETGMVEVVRHLVSVYSIITAITEFAVLSSRLGWTDVRQTGSDAVIQNVSLVHSLSDWTELLQSVSLRHSQDFSTLCTVCGNCTSRGQSCDYNGITPAFNWGRCMCQTSVPAPPVAGMCLHCTNFVQRVLAYIYPHVNHSGETEDVQLVVPWSITVTASADKDADLDDSFISLISMDMDNKFTILPLLACPEAISAGPIISVNQMPVLLGDTWNVCLRYPEHVEQELIDWNELDVLGELDKLDTQEKTEHIGTDVKISPSSMLELVKIEGEDRAEAEISITHSNQVQHTMAFKVKTTVPMSCIVKPNQGFLPPGESISVKVFIDIKDVSRTKMMIQWAAVPAGIDDVKTFWKRIDTRDVKQLVMKCKMKGEIQDKRPSCTLFQMHDGFPKQACYLMEVWRNETLLSQVWIPAGKYQVIPSGGAMVHLHKPCTDTVYMNTLDRVDRRALFPVVELQKRKLAKLVQDWHDILKQFPPDGSTHILLPKDLSLDHLLCPSHAKLWEPSKLSIHQICKNKDVHIKKQSTGETFYHQAHCLDEAGRPLEDKAGETASFLFNFPPTAVAYSELAMTRVVLPQFKQLLPDKKLHDVQRHLVESMLQNLIEVMASRLHLQSFVYPHRELDSPLHNLPSRLLKRKNASRARGGKQKLDRLDFDPTSLFPDSKLTNGMCVSHSKTASSQARAVENVQTLDFKQLGQYSKCLTMYKHNGYKGNHLPEDMCSLMPKMQICTLHGTSNLMSLPEDFSLMTSLRSFHISRGKISKIPVSLMQCCHLSYLVLGCCAITSIPEEIGLLVNLQNMSLASNKISRIPASIGHLQKMTFLNLMGNPLTELPNELGNLKNLRSFVMAGKHWWTMHRNVNTIEQEYTFSQYKEWLSHPRNQMELCLSYERLCEMYKESDHNGDGKLQQAEFADLNAQFYYVAPRFGAQAVDGDPYYGVPSSIFHLDSLQDLNLAYQGFTHLPSAVQNLKNLRSLGLNFCIRLEALPHQLASLPHLKDIGLAGCAALSLPPVEIVSRGTQSVLAYLRRSSSGFTENWRTKLMVVGLGGAGKTSLLRALTSGRYRTGQLTAEDITDGIDVGTWTVTHTSGKKVTFSTWDFAGQTVYYNTHQFFLSKQAVYILLWSMRLSYEHSGLNFWLSSIKCRAPDAPVFVVGTHADQVQKVDIPVDQLKQQYPQIVGFHFVSCLTGQGMQDLESEIISTTLKEVYMGSKVPNVYLSLEETIYSKRRETSLLNWEEIRQLAMQAGIFEEDDIKRAIQFLTDLGTVQYFPTEFLKSKVVISPQWVVDVMAKVVNIKESPIKNGKFFHSDLKSVWGGGHDESMLRWLLSLTEEFDLTFPIPTVPPYNIVPCLLPFSEPEINWQGYEGQPGTRESLMLYKFTYLPAGLFNRAQVRLFQLSDIDRLWKKGSVLKKNGHMAVMQQLSNHEMLVHVKGPRPEGILFLIHEVIEGLVLEAFQGVTFDYLLPCPECVEKEAMTDSLFAASKIRKARRRHAPFLQCDEFFHSVPLPYLQALMPPESYSQFNDFDLHLEDSMQKMQNLKKHMTTDLFFLHGCQQMEGKSVVKKQLRDVQSAVVKEGYSCCYREDLTEASIQEVMVAIQDAKVVLVFLTGAFLNDQACCNLFMHIASRSKKPYIIVLAGNDLSMGWQHTKVGFEIGPHELYIDIRKEEQFSEKMVALFSSIKNKLQQEEAVHPEVFLSYCWTNSKDAINRGTRKVEGATDGADPRDLKAKLEEKGHKVWLDIEQTGKQGLFQDILVGIRHASVVVVCLSAEYAKSKNCMMELRYTACWTDKTIVCALVGSDKFGVLHDNEVGMLLARNKAPVIKLQGQYDDTAVQELVSAVRQTIPKDRPAQEKKEQVPQSLQISQMSYAEECELAQRKFIRYIASLQEVETSSPYPRIFVLDMLENESEEDDEGSFDWMSQLVIRVLCEWEKGWHECGKEHLALQLDHEQVDKKLQHWAPYLTCIHKLLKHSPISLQMDGTEAGSQYISYITQFCDEESGQQVNEAYLDLHRYTREMDTDLNYGSLSRCHLPTGQIRWLCPGHQKESHVRVLGIEDEADLNSRVLVTKTDYQMLAALDKYSHLQANTGTMEMTTSTKPEKIAGKADTAAQAVTEAKSAAVKEEDKTVDTAKPADKPSGKPETSDKTDKLTLTQDRSKESQNSDTKQVSSTEKLQRMNSTGRNSTSSQACQII